MPDLLIIAGPNGAGKSTIFPAIQVMEKFDDSLQPVTIDDQNFINADNIAREFGMSEFSAGKETIKKITESIENGVDFAIETTLSGKSLLSHIKKAEVRGYRIYIVFVFLSSAELSMNRVSQRALLGYHYIPLDRVLARYEKSIHNFFNLYRELADFWVVANNSTLEFTPVCWGGNFFHEQSIYVEDPVLLSKLKEKLQIELIDPINGEDAFTALVLNRIQKVIKKAVKNRPHGNYVVIEDEQGIKFQKASELR